MGMLAPRISLTVAPVVPVLVLVLLLVLVAGGELVFAPAKRR
jgi:hypothetical protein